MGAEERWWAETQPWCPEEARHEEQVEGPGEGGGKQVRSGLEQTAQGGGRWERAGWPTAESSGGGVERVLGARPPRGPQDTSRDPPGRAGEQAGPEAGGWGLGAGERLGVPSVVVRSEVGGRALDGQGRRGCAPMPTLGAHTHTHTCAQPGTSGAGTTNLLSEGSARPNAQ